MRPPRGLSSGALFIAENRGKAALAAAERERRLAAAKRRFLGAGAAPGPHASSEGYFRQLGSFERGAPDSPAVARRPSTSRVLSLQGKNAEPSLSTNAPSRFRINPASRRRAARPPRGSASSSDQRRSTKPSLITGAPSPRAKRARAPQESPRPTTTTCLTGKPQSAP